MSPFTSWVPPMLVQVTVVPGSTLNEEGTYWKLLASTSTPSTLHALSNMHEPSSWVASAL